jgi:hypothetical protein
MLRRIFSPKGLPSHSEATHSPTRMAWRRRYWMFPKSFRMFPESFRMFPESDRMFPEPYGLATTTPAVHQQPRILKSMCNTTPPLRQRVDTGVYHTGSLQELPHTMWPCGAPFGCLLRRAVTHEDGHSITVMTFPSQGSEIPWQTVPKAT